MGNVDYQSIVRLKVLNIYFREWDTVLQPLLHRSTNTIDFFSNISMNYAPIYFPSFQHSSPPLSVAHSLPLPNSIHPDNMYISCIPASLPKDTLLRPIPNPKNPNREK